LYGYTGLEGSLEYPLEYYSGSISEEPGAITGNPYNNTYQSTETLATAFYNMSII
jgi:hypothetical protein